MSADRQIFVHTCVHALSCVKERKWNKCLPLAGKYTVISNYKGIMKEAMNYKKTVGMKNIFALSL